MEDKKILALLRHRLDTPTITIQDDLPLLAGIVNQP